MCILESLVLSLVVLLGSRVLVESVMSVVWTLSLVLCILLIIPLLSRALLCVMYQVVDL